MCLTELEVRRIKMRNYRRKPQVRLNRAAYMKEWNNRLIDGMTYSQRRRLKFHERSIQYDRKRRERLGIAIPIYRQFIRLINHK